MVSAPNLNAWQRRALRGLANNQALTILTADKGGKVVVMDSIQYSVMCELHLQDPAYELVKSFGRGRGKITLRNQDGSEILQFVKEDYKELDPSDRLLKMQCRKLTEMLNTMVANGDPTAEHRKKIITAQPYAGAVPKFYGLPKIHKVGILKLRPIVSNIDIYCDKVLLHQKDVLNVLFRGDFAVLNSYDFVSRLDQLQISMED